MNYINGKFVVTPFSEGEMYGIGVFETILIKDGVAVFLEEHYNRCLKGCQVLGISFNLAYSSYKKQVEKYIERYPRKNYAMRVTVSKRSYNYDLMISSREIPYQKETYQKGYTLKVSNIFRNPSSPIVGVKSLNYSENLMALRSVREEGYNEVLFLNYKGEVCEGAVSNIFFKKDGVIKTPSVECGLLPGIMRARVMEELKAKNIIVEEGSYSLEELLDADEVFLTNSLMGQMPVVGIEK